MIACLLCAVSLLAAEAGKPAVRKPVRTRLRTPAAKPYVKQPSALERKILDALACASPENAAGVAGLYAVELATGRVILDWNGRNTFTPASNTKLVSTAVALTRLGPEHTFETKLASDVPVDANGILRGNLYWVGGGDPALASRHLAALRKEEFSADQTIAGFVNSLWDRGVRHITGDIVGDDSHFPRDLYPIGWTIDDSLEDYGAPVSALTYHENTQAITVSAAGGIQLSPQADYYTISPLVAPGEQTNLSLKREGRQLLIEGTVREDRPSVQSVAVDEPALFAAMVLKEALQQRGIRVDGVAAARSRHEGEARRDPPAVVLHTQRSASLSEILKIVNKSSHNLFAEIALREAARVRAGEGSRRAAIAEMRQFLEETGAAAGCCYFQDGSGLSRQTLVTAEAVTRVLQHMYASSHREAWIDTLPVGGVDGSLTRRFAAKELKDAGTRIRAKTGSLAHVATLSGYALATSRGDVAFSILLNHYNGSGAEARTIIDKIAVAIAE